MALSLFIIRRFIPNMRNNSGATNNEIRLKLHRSKNAMRSGSPRIRFCGIETSKLLLDSKRWKRGRPGRKKATNSKNAAGWRLWQRYLLPEKLTL